MKPLQFLVCSWGICVLISASPLFAQQHSLTAAVASQPQAGATVPIGNGTTQSDDISPGMFAGMFFLLVLIAIAAILAAIIIALVCAVALMGIVSSSMMVGFLTRKVGPGARAFFIQLGAAGGIPCGIGFFWLFTWLIQANLSWRMILLIGGFSGIICGIIIALMFNFVWGKIVEYLTSRIGHRSVR